MSSFVKLKNLCIPLWVCMKQMSTFYHSELMTVDI